MASITIRNLDEETKRRLKIRAASLNRSMEEEARHILRAALKEEENPVHLADRIWARFQRVGGVDCPLPPREPIGPAPDLLS